MDFFNARYFTAALGRFNSPDPGNVGADLSNPQTLNGYAYVGNNPLQMTDPSGMDSIGSGDGGYDPCLEDPFLCDAPPPIFFPTPAPPVSPPPIITESAGGNPLPPGSFPGGETLGLPPEFRLPGVSQFLSSLFPFSGCEFGACGGGPLQESAVGNNGNIPQRDGYGAYASCLILHALPAALGTAATGIGLTSALGKSYPEPYPVPTSILRKLPVRAATSGLKWGTKGSIVGAAVFAFTFEVELNQGARGCAAAGGYTPWIFE